MQAQIIPNAIWEERELLRKRAELLMLKTNLEQREEELSTLQTELTEFQKHYLSIVGYLYSELDEVESQIAEVPGRIGLNESPFRSHKTVDDAFGSNSVRSPKVSPDSKKLSEKLKKLYREIAKCFHPDLADNESDRIRHQQIMMMANEAYRSGNEDQLETILKRSGGNVESGPGKRFGTELLRISHQITQVQQRLWAITAEMFELKESSLYQFKLKVADAETHGLDLVAEMAGFLRRQIVKAKVRLANLRCKHPLNQGSTGLSFDDVEILRNHLR